jgi:hypothetical protein
LATDTPGSGAMAGPGNAKDEHAERDEHAELERLRAEVSSLRAQKVNGNGTPTHTSGARRGRWRAYVSVVAIVLGCVLAPISVLGVWASNQVSNTDRYVANVTPLIGDPAIQTALSTKITSVITKQLDVNALVNQAASQLSTSNAPRLSTLLKNFSGPISNGINGVVGTAVARVVASPAMARVWVQANRTAHAGIVKVLSGQGNGAVDVVDGKVTISLGPFITQAEQALTNQGFSLAAKLPSVNPTFPLFDAPNLSKAQAGYRLINTLKWVLPFLSLALLAAGVYIARGRRRALLGAALGLSASMLVLGAALAIARGIYLNSVPQSTLPPDAAAVLYDTLVRFIKDGLRLLLVVGLVIAAGAFLTGPSGAAVQTRHAVTSGIGWLRTWIERRGLDPGPVGAWTGAHKRVLQIGVIALAALIFVFWGQPTLAVAIWIVVLLLVALGLIELIGGRTGGAETAARS